MYKFLNNNLPSVCLDLVLLNVCSNHTYNMRNNSAFLIPAFRTTLSKKCIKIVGQDCGILCQ